jgi:hypothetical protein
MSELVTGATFGDDFRAEARNQLAASGKLISHCVAQLSDEQIWHRQRDDLNSIGNLLLHLAGNLAQRFGSGINGEPDRRDRPREFTERSAIPKAALMSRLDEAIAAADTILQNFDPASLNELRPYATFAGTVEISVMAVIFRTLVHLNGHAQEILYMTRVKLEGGYEFQNPAGVPKPAMV